MFNVAENLRVFDFERDHETGNGDSFDRVQIYFVVQKPIDISNGEDEAALLELHAVADLRQHINTFEPFPHDIWVKLFFPHHTKFVNYQISNLTQVHFNSSKYLLNRVKFFCFGVQR